MANIEQILGTDFVYPEGLEKINDNFIAINNEVGLLDTELGLVVVDLATKQATLISGVNIKTINGASILGSGNMVVSGGGGGGGDANIKIILPNISAGTEVGKPVFFGTLGGGTEYLKPTGSQDEYVGILNALVGLNDGEVQVSGSIDNITLYNTIQGLDLNTSLKTKLYLLLQSVGGWQDKLANPQRSLVGLAYYGDFIYFMNGSNSGRSDGGVTSCSKYSVSNNTWTSISSSPLEKSGCHAMEYNGNIRTLYGPDRAYSGISYGRPTYEYNILSNTYSDLSGTVQSYYSRGGFNLGNNNYFYLFGGQSGNSSLTNSSVFYNPLNNTYTGILSTPISSAFIGDRYNDDVGYLIGLNTFYTYDRLTNTYTTLPTAPTNFTNSYGQAKIINGILYAQVGFLHYSYNIATTTWTQLPNSSVSRDYSTIVKYGLDRYYIMGGTSSLTTNQVFTPSELYTSPVLTVNPIGFEVGTLYNWQKLVMKHI